MLITGDFFFVKPGEVHDSYINAYQTKLYNLLFVPAALGDSFSALSALPGLDEYVLPLREKALTRRTVCSTFR